MITSEVSLFISSYGTYVVQFWMHLGSQRFTQYEMAKVDTVEENVSWLVCDVLDTFKFFVYCFKCSPEVQ